MIAVASAPWSVSSSSVRFCFPYIGQFARHGNEATDRNGLGAPGWIDIRGDSQPRRVDRERFEALPQHFSTLAESRRRNLLERTAIAELRGKAGHQSHHRRGHLWLRHERGWRNVEQNLCFSAPVREHRKSSIGFLVLLRNDAFGHFALKHQHHHIVPGWPRLDRKPVYQQRRGNVVRQVRNDFGFMTAE